MNIKKSIFAGMIVFMLVMALNVIVGLDANKRLGDMLDYIAGPAWNAADGAMEGQIGLEAQIIILQKIYYGESSISNSEESLREAIAMEQEALGRMRDSGLMSAQTIQMLDVKLNAYQDSRDAMIGKLRTDQAVADEYKAMSVEVEGLLAFIGKMEEEADSKVEGETQNVSDLQSDARTKLVIAFIVNLVLCILVYFFSIKFIVEPLAAVTGSLQNLASGSGDLTARLPNGSDTSEIGRLALSFNHFIEKLQRLIN